jgi:hypothetical protein
MGIDSGAAVTVLPRNLCADYPLAPNEASVRGVAYRAANGAAVKDEGTRTIQVRTSSGTTRHMRARVCDVTKGLMSVAEMVDANHTVVFSPDRSFARHNATGEISEFRRRNNVFELDLQVLPYVGPTTELRKNVDGGVLAALTELRIGVKPFQGPVVIL